MENLYSKMEALEYLANANFYRNEWTEAGMFHNFCHIITSVSDKEMVTESYLDDLIEKAEKF